MKAFEQIYTEFSSQIYNYLLYLSGSSDVAEELMQETFYQAFISIHRFKGNCELRTWLYQIGKHSYYKLNKKELKQGFNVGNYIDIADLHTPEKAYEIKEVNKSFKEAIRRIDQPYKDVLVLRLVNELKFKEIAEVLNQTENWSKVTFYRGKLKLRVVLEKELIE
ncbi:MAG: sigma-70 family RNA polymerase sigma factor [Clostridiaceae bacterium]|nr:sigma-70 family RNA polymerase sigma factor [Clostridiaceae bacterium]